MSEKLPTYREFVATWTHRLRDAGVPDARRSVDWIVEDEAGLTRTQLLIERDSRMPPDLIRRCEELLRRRARREPLQYILGAAEFHGLTYRVTPDVLIPRPETEVVVDEAVAIASAANLQRVVDVGTGSGCIACTVKHLLPHADVAGCDVSPEALAVARANAEALGLDVTFFPGDMRDDDLLAAAGPIDLLISNPPYIPDRERAELEAEVVDFEPWTALFSGDDPLFYYRRLMNIGGRYLTGGGAIVLEVHIDHADDVAAEARRAGLVDVRIVNDLTQRPRVVTARQPRAPAASL